MNFSRIGARKSLVSHVRLATMNSGTKIVGGNFSKASQLVNTTRPILVASDVSSSWHTAPPVSLPTRVTSVRSSAASAWLTMPATPSGDMSAPASMGVR